MFKWKKSKAPKEPEVFRSFMSGTLKDLDTVPDQVFSKRIMGDGFAIDPDEGTVVAPCSGIVSVAFPTGHAVGITTDEGMEVLLHLGVDTVELNGKGFTSFVKQGQRVKQGDVLVNMDLDQIRAAGKPVISMCIFTSGRTIKDLATETKVSPSSESFFKFI